MRLDSARFISHSSNALAGVSDEMLFFTGIADMDFSKINHLSFTPFFSLDGITINI
jgi:hypothetical protein